MESQVDQRRFEGIPLPKPGSEPDPTTLRNWAEGQHSDLHPFVHKLVQSILNNYCSFEQFIIALDESVQAVEKVCGDNPKGILCSSDCMKSGYWVSRLCNFQKKANVIKSPIDFLPSWLGDGKLSTEELEIADWIIVDDAVYSCTQLKEEILPNFLRGLFRQIPQDKTIRIHLAIPFMTAYAKNYIENRLLKDLGEKIPCLLPILDRVTLLPTQTRQMPSLDNIIDSLKEKDRKVANRFLIQWGIRDNSRIATTYFAHKVGDSLSFPSFLTMKLCYCDYEKETGRYLGKPIDKSPVPYIKQPYKFGW